MNYVKEPCGIRLWITLGFRNPFVLVIPRPVMASPFDKAWTLLKNGDFEEEPMQPEENIPTTPNPYANIEIPSLDRRVLRQAMFGVPLDVERRLRGFESEQEAKNYLDAESNMWDIAGLNLAIDEKYRKLGERPEWEQEEAPPLDPVADEMQRYIDDAKERDARFEEHYSKPLPGEREIDFLLRRKYPERYVEERARARRNFTG